jgi:hypothetical protein
MLFSWDAPFAENVQDTKGQPRYVSDQDHREGHDEQEGEGGAWSGLAEADDAR